MDDIAVGLEHVHLLNCGDGLHVHLLESGLQLLVVGTGALVDLLDLSSRRTLASVAQLLMKILYVRTRAFRAMEGSGDIAT